MMMMLVLWELGIFVATLVCGFETNSCRRKARLYVGRARLAP